MDATHYEELNENKIQSRLLLRPQSAKYLINGTSQRSFKTTSKSKSRPISAIQSTTQRKPQEKLKLDLKFPTSVKEQNILSTVRPKSVKSKNIKTKEQMDYMEIKKMKPKYIKLDKERLYEDTIYLKNSLNSSIAENTKLKTKILNLQKDNSKMQKIIADVESYLTNQKKNNPSQKIILEESFLIIGLKKQVAELKEKLSEKETEISSFKKSSKLLKVEELEIELQNYMAESNRLKSYLEQLGGSRRVADDEFYNSSLKRENMELRANSMVYQEQIQQLKTSLELQERKYVRFYEEQKRTVKRMKEKEEEIADLKSEINDLIAENHTLIVQSQIPSKEQKRAEMMINAENQLKSTILQKEQVISYQEKMINELKNKMAEKAALETKERKNILEDLSKQKEMYQDIEEKYKTLLAHANIEEKRKNDRKKVTEISDSSIGRGMRGSLRQYHLEVQENGSQNMSIDPINDQLKSSKKLFTVKSEEVKNIGYELNMRFRLKGLQINDAISFLFTEKMKSKGSASIKDLINILQIEPFCIKSEESAQLLARYLVEDNDQETVEFNMNQTNSLAVIKSIFKRIVGDFTLLTKQEEEKTRDEVTQKITKFRSTLEQAFKNMPEIQSKHVGVRELQTPFKYFDIDLSKKHFEFMVMKLFERSNDISKLDPNLVFELFFQKPENSSQARNKPKPKMSSSTSSIKKESSGISGLEMIQSKESIKLKKASMDEQSEIMEKSETISDSSI